MQFGDKVKIKPRTGYMDAQRKSVLGQEGIVVAQAFNGLLTVVFEVEQEVGFLYLTIFITENEVEAWDAPAPPPAEEFEEYAQKLADEVRVELMGIYNDGAVNGYVEDDGFLHVTRGYLRASFDVGNGLTPTQKRANIKAIKKAISASVWA